MMHKTVIGEENNSANLKTKKQESRVAKMNTTITVSKTDLNSINLPGMGRSIELNGLKPDEHSTLREAFASKTLQVEFEEEKGTSYPVINLWSDPHSHSRLTVFI